MDLNEMGWTGFAGIRMEDRGVVKRAVNFRVP